MRPAFGARRSREAVEFEQRGMICAVQFARIGQVHHAACLPGRRGDLNAVERQGELDVFALYAQLPGFDGSLDRVGARGLAVEIIRREADHVSPRLRSSRSAISEPVAVLAWCWPATKPSSSCGPATVRRSAR